MPGEEDTYYEEDGWDSSCGEGIEFGAEGGGLEWEWGFGRCVVEGIILYSFVWEGLAFSGKHDVLEDVVAKVLCGLAKQIGEEGMTFDPSRHEEDAGQEQPGIGMPQ